jgi:hypothetical protein
MQSFLKFENNFFYHKFEVVKGVTRFEKFFFFFRGGFGTRYSPYNVLDIFLFTGQKIQKKRDHSRRRGEGSKRL